MTTRPNLKQPGPSDMALLRELPDCTLSRAEVGFLLDVIEGLRGKVAPEPFTTTDHYGNRYRIEHGNVATDAPTVVTLIPEGRDSDLQELLGNGKLDQMLRLAASIGQGSMTIDPMASYDRQRLREWRDQVVAALGRKITDAD